MLKDKFNNMFKLPSPELITRFQSLCLSLVMMLGVFLVSPVHAQADTTKSNFDSAIFSRLIADAAVEPEAIVETPEAKAAAKAEAKKAKAAAKAEAKKAKAAAKLEAKKLKEAEEAKAEEIKAAEKAAKKAAKLEAKKAKEAEKAAEMEAVEEKEKAMTESVSPETTTEPTAESTPTEVVVP